MIELLICTRCKASLSCEAKQRDESGDIFEGILFCQKCNQQYPITNGIPRFVKTENYASSFGYQWQIFRKEQLDSHNGTSISAERFWSETNWTRDELTGKWILDVGCGVGRFLDVISKSKAEVAGVDISSAIDAAKANLEDRDNVHFVQASIYDLRFREETFDFCYCIGIIQYTPDPPKALSLVAKTMKKEGKIAVTTYERKPWTKLYSKYWLRPITKRIKKKSF
ncbi:MAG: methyltransferase domain-containing protein [Pyrinomonadaceae bacterium]|nr:methyltransferase domain-containing protein [Pyrinomonadaceae bacterium]MCX7640299.1 methyltransferase domain-containing protein [Pyrinomonadaceae bacterium]MDW8305253.1 methyltransferase domain-containing protein [Acidobacteriota bacterium]